MAEISALPKKSSPMKRMPQRIILPAGVDLHEHLDLARYEPPMPQTRPTKPVQHSAYTPTLPPLGLEDELKKETKPPVSRTGVQKPAVQKPGVQKPPGSAPAQTKAEEDFPAFETLAANDLEAAPPEAEKPPVSEPRVSEPPVSEPRVSEPRVSKHASEGQAARPNQPPARPGQNGGGQNGAGLFGKGNAPSQRPGNPNFTRPQPSQPSRFTPGQFHKSGGPLAPGARRAGPDVDGDARDTGTPDAPPQTSTPRPGGPVLPQRPPPSPPQTSREGPAVQRTEPAAQKPEVEKPATEEAPPRSQQQKPLDQVELTPPASQPPASQPPARPRLLPTVPEKSLSEVLESSRGLPAQTAVLGICDDGLPMLLDLNDPMPGAVLVMGDERQIQLDLLRTAVSSVALRNTARGAQFIVFSHLPDAWNEWVDEQGFARYCLGVVGVDSQEARDWIERLADWTEQRMQGIRSGPPVLILMDTLNFIPKLGELRERFELLVRDGPGAAIWPVAAISTALAGTLSRHLSLFQTLLFGYSEDKGFYVRMAGLKESEARGFLEPGQFAVRVVMDEGESWMRFHLPSPG